MKVEYLNHYLNYDPLEVANFVISISLKYHMQVTNIELQKILFFMQGLTLKTYGTKLINGNFVKNQYGPIQKEVYDAFKHYGSAPIKTEFVTGYFDSTGQLQIQKPQIKNMNEDEKAILVPSVIELIITPVYKLQILIETEPSYYNYKNEIMANIAPDYTDNEIVECFNNIYKLKDPIILRD